MKTHLANVLDIWKEKEFSPFKVKTISKTEFRKQKQTKRPYNSLDLDESDRREI